MNPGRQLHTKCWMIRATAALMLLGAPGLPRAIAGVGGPTVPAQAATGAPNESRPVTLVLANATPSDALTALSAAGNVRILLGRRVNPQALHALTITARQAPFNLLLQQVAQAEDLVVTNSPDAYILDPAHGSYYGPGAAPPPANGPGAAGGFGGGGFRSPTPGTSSTSDTGGGSAPAAMSEPLRQQIPTETGLGLQTSTTNGAPPAAGHSSKMIMEPDLSPSPANVALSAGATSQPFTGTPLLLGSGQQPVSQLEYVLEYARNPRPSMFSPSRVIAGLQTTAGSLQYLAVVTEALTHAAGPVYGGIQNGMVGRLRTLLGEAEDIHHRACQREQLQTEILVLQAHLPQADPTSQPFLRDILARRQHDLNLLGP